MRSILCLASCALLGAIGCGGDGSTVTEPVASLRFISAPATTAAGVAQDISIELLNANGGRAAGASDQVTLAVSDGSTFTGPSNARADNGLVNFRAVTLTHAASSIYLRATSGAFTASTGVFSVTPGAASPLQTTAVVASAQIVPTEATSVTFHIADQYGNPISAHVSVHATPAGTFSPDSGTSNQAGVFASSFRSATGGSAAISATVGQTTITLATALSVCANPTVTFPATVSGDITANSCLADGRRTAFYRFTTSPIRGAAFTLSSQFAPRLAVTTDPPLANAYALPNQNLPFEWLLPAGTYELRLSAVNGTGTYSLAGALGAGNAGCVRRFLATVGVYDGQALTTGDCDYDGTSVVDKYVVYSPNPCSFRLHSTTFTNFIFLMELGTGHFLDGRGGDPIGVDALFGMPSCSYAGSPVEVWVLPDENQAGGAYTLTYTLFPIPGLRAGEVTIPASRERVAVDPRVLRRLRAMAASAPR